MAVRRADSVRYMPGEHPENAGEDAGLTAEAHGRAREKRA
jgi:hypothetical protein